MKKLNIKLKKQDHKEKNYVGSISKVAGIGYELYAKGLDRVSAQCNTISDYAKNLAKLVRENATERKKKKVLKDLQKWVDVLNKEMEGIVSDINNLEGYKSSSSQLKTAGEQTILEMLLGKDARTINVIMRNSMDEQTQKLALQVWVKLNDLLTLKGSAILAFNKLWQSIDAGKNYSPEMHRNNIFKAADALGIKLPSGIF